MVLNPGPPRSFLLWTGPLGAETGQCSPCNSPNLHTQSFCFSFPYYFLFLIKKINVAWACVCLPVCLSAWGRRKASWERGMEEEKPIPQASGQLNHICSPGNKVLLQVPPPIPPCTQSLCVVLVTLLHWLSELRPEDPASQRGERRGEGWEPSLTRVTQGELPFSHLCPLSSPSESQLLELGSRWGRPAQTSHESVFEIVLDLFCN